VLLDNGDEYDISILTLSVGQKHTHDVIRRGSNFYETFKKENCGADDTNAFLRQELPPPEQSAIEHAIQIAVDNDKCQAVKKYLPLFDVTDPPLSWIVDRRDDMDRYFINKKKSADGETKLRKYFGMVMYDVYIVMDLVSTVIPRRK